MTQPITYKNTCLNRRRKENMRWSILLIYLCCLVKIDACPTICRCANTSVYCFYKGITTKQFITILPDIPTHVTKLYLSGNAIDVLPIERLSHLKSLRYLSLNFNKLSSLPTNLSHYLPALKELYVTANKIHDLSKLSGYENIELLNLNQNMITSIPDYIFSKMDQLHELLLGQNQIENIHKNAFHGLKNLQKIQLNNNRMKYIDEDAFNYLLNIKEIYLHMNVLTTIQHNLFKKNIYLETLYLSNNKIHKVENDAFTGLHNLATLYLDNNKLTEFPSKAFDDKQITRKIYMNDNTFICDCNLLAGLSLNTHFKYLLEEGILNLGNCVHSSTKSRLEISLLNLKRLNCSACDLNPCKKGFDCITSSINEKGRICIDNAPPTTTQKTTLPTTTYFPIDSIAERQSNESEDNGLMLWVIIAVCSLIICILVILFSWFMYQRKQRKEFVVTSSSGRLTYDKVRYSQDTLLDGTLKSNVSSSDSTFNFEEIAHV